MADLLQPPDTTQSDVTFPAAPPSATPVSATYHPGVDLNARAAQEALARVDAMINGPSTPHDTLGSKLVAPAWQRASVIPAPSTPTDPTATADHAKAGIAALLGIGPAHGAAGQAMLLHPQAIGDWANVPPSRGMVAPQVDTPAPRGVGDWANMPAPVQGVAPIEPNGHAPPAPPPAPAQDPNLVIHDGHPAHPNNAAQMSDEEFLAATSGMTNRDLAMANQVLRTVSQNDQIRRTMLAKAATGPHGVDEWTKLLNFLGIGAQNAAGVGMQFPQSDQQ